jgi:exodeoxyribonuclease VII small subunit
MRRGGRAIGFDRVLLIGYFVVSTDEEPAALPSPDRWVRKKFPRVIRMGKSPGSEPPQSFEAALAELEKIVASMESGKLTLEQSLVAHKRGLELAQYCQSALAQAQQQVKVLEEGTLKNFTDDASRG